MTKEYFDTVMVGVSETVKAKMVIIPHCYGSNHPFDFPYDAINQHDHPGATIVTDDTAVLRFLTFAAWCKPYWADGYVPPMIVGEGGWEYGETRDNRYPKVEKDLWVKYHIALYEMFRTRQMPAGLGILPDYLFGFCSFLLHDGGQFISDSWVDGINEAGIKPLRDYLISAKPFVREFGTVTPIPPPPPPDPGQSLIEALYAAAAKQPQIQVSPDGTMARVAQAKSLGNPQTEEFEFPFGGAEYIAQVFQGGIVAVSEGDFKVVNKPSPKSGDSQ